MPRNARLDRVRAAVVGEDDAAARRIAGVLSQHRYDVVFHPSPRGLLAEYPGENLESEFEAATRRYLYSRPDTPAGQPEDLASERPDLFVLNWPGKRSGTRIARAFVDAVKSLTSKFPRTAILVTVDNEQAHGTIRGAIRAGADEILTAGETEVAELVWTRVQSALAKAKATAVTLPRLDRTGAVVERRQGERRRADRRRAGAGDIVETWEDPVPGAEASAARERVQAALKGLPAPEERRAPLADVLGILAPGLRAPSGRLDARKIAGQLGVPLARLAKLTPISRQALNETPDSVHAQAALDPLARILDILHTVLPRDHASAWLNAAHARLGGEAPIHAILDGRGEQVARMLERARDGGVD
jgi:hypothetical protein